MRSRPTLWLLCLACLLAARPGYGQVVEGQQAFYPDDPLWEDPDRLDAPVPEESESSWYVDLVKQTFASPAEYEGPALNVNTLGEVPNSSWYTNRHYWHPMTPEELAWGPNKPGRPAPAGEGRWQVVDGKQEGATLGMQVVDARGDRYILKFDPKEHPEMTTGAEAIVTKLFYAFGYNVPENYVVYFTRDQIVPDPEATYETPGGEELPITDAFIDTLLTSAYRYPDGRYRALASKFLEGKPVGPFEYYGRRPDDANDLYPHEARRELRGMKVFGALVNHYDARSGNSLDMAVEEDGKTYLRHYLIDFGSTLGSGATQRIPRWTGSEYTIEPRAIVTRALTLGFGGSSWVDVDYPSYQSVGRFEADHFDPQDWKPQIPNPAFERADEADAFWAARQVMNLSEEALRAIAATAQFSDDSAEEYLVQTLLRRRDAIGKAYLSFGGGLDRFRVEGGSLFFEDLMQRYLLAPSVPRRTVRWRPFNNETSTPGSVFEEAEFTGVSLKIPSSGAAFLLAEIETPGRGATHVYLRRQGERRYEVVGIERR